MSRRFTHRLPAPCAALLAGAAWLFSSAVDARAEEASKPVPAGETAPAPALDSPRIRTDESTSVHVQVIAATTQEGKAPGSEIDERLASLQNRLSDFAFSTYRLVEEKRLELVLQQQQTLSLPGGRTLHITPKQVETSGKLRVHLLVKSRRARHLVDADYSIEPGGDILVGGMRLKKGGALLVAIHHGE